MIKIVATLHNFGAAANLGGGVESVSEVIDIPTSDIPPRLAMYLRDKDCAKWQCLSLSLMDDVSQVSHDDTRDETP